MHAARIGSRSKEALIERYRKVRAATEALAAPLGVEDQVLQSMPSASPTKWHRAHTTWFFETFLLAPAGVASHDERFGFLFNSYYDSVGDRVARERRGMLSRPTVDEVATYRRAVDGRVVEHLASLDDQRIAAVADIMELGLAHEQQHQELILTDILHAFSQNPTGPAYRAPNEGARAAAPEIEAQHSPSWRRHSGGLVDIGAPADLEFAFDNERPQHKVFLRDFEVAEHAVTVGELRAFIREQGYQTPSLWLSEGYETIRARGWRAPEYTRNDADGFRVFSLRGWRAPADDEVASHLSFWEAEALARFLGARLPTETEWEHAARSRAPAVDGNFVDDGALHPVAASARMFGDVWQWTRSAYEPYPGFAPAAGAVGEYNGKFMAQQYVLRGGSCLTPRGHVRASYRNFWHPDTRFQMNGVRLARDV